MIYDIYIYIYIFAEVRGLDILYLWFMFSRSFSVLFMFVLCLFVRLVYLSCCIYNRKHTYKNINTKHKQLREKHKANKTTKYIISQPEPERYLFVVGSRAGSLTMERNPLLWKGIPYYRRKSLTPLLYKYLSISFTI